MKEPFKITQIPASDPRLSTCSKCGRDIPQGEWMRIEVGPGEYTAIGPTGPPVIVTCKECKEVDIYVSVRRYSVCFTFFRDRVEVCPAFGPFNGWVIYQFLFPRVRRFSPP